MRLSTSRHLKWLPILLTAFGLATGASAQNRSALSLSADAPAILARYTPPPAGLRGGPVLLYNQVQGTATSGTVSQNNTTATTFDNAIADDFVVPAGVSWSVSRVFARGFYTTATGGTPGTCAQGDVTFYNNGPGEPGTVISTQRVAPTTDATGQLTFDITPVALASGATASSTYWMGIVCNGPNLNLGINGRWNWFNNTIIRGTISQIINPGGGFNLPPGWNDLTADRDFSLSGTSTGTAVFPELVLNPTALTATVPSGGTTTATLAVQNTGQADLTFSFPGFAALARIQELARQGVDLNRREVSMDVPMVKGAEGIATSGGTGMEYRVGGPDAFGYTFIDSSEPGGPVFDATTNIAATGSPITFADLDDGETSVTLPFSFRFYGTSYTTLLVGVNGAASFTAADIPFSNSATMPNAAVPNALLAPLWDDYDARTTGGRVLTQTLADGRFVIQWDNLTKFGASEAGAFNTFQVILGMDGSITYQYLDINLVAANSNTIGIENQAGTQGLLVNANTAGYAVDGLAVRFNAPTLFLSGVSPTSGTVAPGATTNVTVSISGSDNGAPIAPGTYTQNLRISTNDADEASVVIPVTLTVTGASTGDPIVVTPNPVVETLASGTTGTETVTIQNNTGEPVTYTFPQYGGTARPTAPWQAPAVADAAKGDDTPRGGTASRGGGGPDAFGYQWTDSNQPGGPVYAFTDISATGTGVTLTDDSATPAIPLPFTFSFYGADYSSVFISSNGHLTFGTPSTDFSNDPIPTVATPNNFVAPYWDDFNPADGGQIDYQTLADGSFVVQFTDVPRFTAGTGTATFQAILYPSGAIKYQYRSVPTTNNSGTIGIENVDGTDGLQVAFNAAYAAPNLAVLIQARPTFVTSVTPPSGTIPAGGSATVAVGFDATGLNAGQYTGEIDLIAGDSTLALGVVLNVTGQPTVTVTPNPVAFGDLIVGFTDSLDVTIANGGTSDLVVSAITSSNPAFTVVGTTPVTIAPGATAVVTVVFTPTAPGAATGTLSVVSNAASSPNTVTLSGNGLAPPNFSVSPGSLTVSVPSGGGPVTRPLTLSNTGAGAGTFTADAVVITGPPRPASVSSASGTVGKDGGLLRSDGATSGAGVGLGGSPQTMFRGGLTTITQNTSQEIVPVTGIACPTPPNAVFRRFELSDFEIAGNFDVQTVEFGIESVSGAQTSTINLYRLEGAFVRANMTLVGTATRAISPADDLTIVSVPITGSFASDDVMVVEWTYPLAQTFFGGNSAGQSGPTYVQANGCNLAEPGDLADLGFPDAHWVVNVIGQAGAPLIAVSPESGTVAAGGSQILTVTIDATDTPPGSYQAEVRIATNEPGEPVLVVPVSIVLTVGTEDDGQIPAEVSLSPGYPNPVSSSATLTYGLPEAGPVRVRVYDVAGRLVATVVDAERSAGYHDVEWDARTLASGVYFVRMQAGAESRTVRISVVR